MQNSIIERTGQAFICIALSVALIFSGVLTASAPAYGVTSAEKQAEADEIMQNIDTLQTQINEANTELDRATQEYETASAAADEASDKVDAANERIVELKELLSERALSMYKTGGSMSFLDVLLEAASFEEFLTMWDMFDKISEQDATMIQETKDLRQEAENAQVEYEEQMALAEEEMANIESAKSEIETAKADMEVSLASVTEEIVLLKAKEEEERMAAEEAQRLADQAGRLVDVRTGFRLASGWAHPCPTAKYVSSGYGYREYDQAFHHGVDYAADTGTPIYAATVGTVSYVGPYGTGGQTVKISHGNGMVTLYMHMSGFATVQGTAVNAGDLIGYVGSTGNSSGPHLHFQVDINGDSVDGRYYVGW